MTIHKTLGDIMDALKTNHLEHGGMERGDGHSADLAAVRTEVATKVSSLR